MLKYKISASQYEELDEAVKALYKGRDDEYTLQVDGVKTQEDVDSVREALRKEREDHDATKGKIKALEGDVGTLTDKVKVYESDESKKLSAEERVEMERLKRELEAKEASLGGMTTELETLKGEITTGKIKDELKKSAIGVVREEAVPDLVEILAKDFVFSDGKVLTSPDMGDRSGLDARAYLSSYVEGRSYLAPTSAGGGSKGGKGSSGGLQSGGEAPSAKDICNDIWSPKG
jgi:hypothetical protein